MFAFAFFAVRIALVALTLAGLEVPATAATSAPALAVLPFDAQATVTYRFDMPGASGVEGNGGTIVLQRTDDSTVAVTVTTPGTSAPASYKATIQKDGTLGVGAVRPWCTALNEVIAISRDATANLEAGQMWSSTTTLQSASGDASVDVPLKVLVASRADSATGEQIQLMAAGGLHAVVRETSSVASPRVALYLQLAGHFLNGFLQDASGNMTGSMVNGVASKDPGESPSGLGATVQGGANGGGIGWTLTLVTPSSAPASTATP
ncbi:MAG TPA: hypothetical protein VME66_14265 [Candidatus Acidoferrales bacterium]|nr:hypothetical protein [Candidatus Acidoferrales bacterium]